MMQVFPPFVFWRSFTNIIIVIAYVRARPAFHCPGDRKNGKPLNFPVISRIGPDQDIVLLSTKRMEKCLHSILSVTLLSVDSLRSGEGLTETTRSYETSIFLGLLIYNSCMKRIQNPYIYSRRPCLFQKGQLFL